MNIYKHKRWTNGFHCKLFQYPQSRMSCFLASIHIYSSGKDHESVAKYGICLCNLYDMVSFKHEFFMQISQTFPLFKYFSMMNGMIESWNDDELKSDNNSTDSVIEYPHLTSLDLIHVHID